MKKTGTIIAAILISLAAMGQETKHYAKLLDTEAKASPYRHTYMLKSFTNTGSRHIEDALTKAKADIAGSYNADDENETLWYNKPFFIPVEDEADAQVIISATYAFDSGTKTEKKVHHNREMPYSMSYPLHQAQGEVIITYKYKDGTPTHIDTIAIAHSSKEIPGKKFRTLTQIDDAAIASIIGSCPKPRAALESKEWWIKFPKVKIKDKDLKIEYATIQALLKANKYAEAGTICRRVYESDKSPEASAALGLCYELLGNYPKANEYIKPFADFHIKARMRKNIAVLDYAKSIGYEPSFIEF